MLKRAAAMTALTLAVGVVPMLGHASVPPEGCAMAGGQGIDSYTASQNGGIVGAGDYVVTVFRPSTEETFTYDMLDGPKLTDDAVIVPGDEVTCAVTAGFVAAGNPEP